MVGNIKVEGKGFCFGTFFFTLGWVEFKNSFLILVLLFFVESGN